MSNSSIYEGDRLVAATDTDSLETRLRINAAYSSEDFSSWLFSRLDIQEGEDILDVGCGNGAQSLPFANMVGPGGSVSALDISESSIAEINAKKPGDANLTAVAADMADLEATIADSFPVKTYDLAQSSYALYYSANREQVLDTMRKSLKPAGRCAIFTPNAPHGLVEFAARFHDIDPEIWNCFRFAGDVLKPYFKDNFKTVDEYHFHNVVRIPDAETLVSFYKATTYFEAEHLDAFKAEAEKIVADKGIFEYEKNGYLIVGRDSV